MTDYPVLITALFIIIFTTILLIVVDKFDKTKGPLTISIIIVLAFVGAMTLSLLYTIPNDEITSAAAGVLFSAFTSVVAFWIYRRNGKE